MIKPSYFDEIQGRARTRWNQLASDPELAAPWYQLFKQVQSPRHVLSELLQNADDVGATEARVSVESDVFTFSHNGEDFTGEQFASLCRFGYSNKRALHTIGFRGIGFKSTFSLGDVVELSTPTLSVAYRRQRFTEPLWMGAGRPELHTRVRVRLSGPNKQRELEQNFAEWLRSPFSLLFFKNIRSIQIGAKKLNWKRMGPGPVGDSEWMALGPDSTQSYLLIRSDPEPFPEEALNEIYEERLLRPEEEGAFPPCRVEIVVGAEGRLHVVLPTGVGTALPFAANAPFIQDPARLKIKSPDVSATNRWLLERIGRLSARAMFEWLQRDGLEIADRAGAYSLLPDVDRDDASLEGRCAATVELACGDALGDSPFLLTEGGQLGKAGTVVAVPGPLLEVWPGDQAGTLLDTNSRPPLSSHVSQQHRKKLASWHLIDVLSRSDVVSRMKASHLPKPRTWRQLLTLWGYLAPELGGYPYHTTKKSINLLPVQGRDVLHAANEVVRLGERRLLQSDADWALLADHMLVLNQNWPRFLADKRRSLGDDEADGAEVHAALGLLASLDLEQSSDVSEVIERVAATFFAQPKVPVSKAVRLTQVAAKLGATVGKSFRFVTRDHQLRSNQLGLLFDKDRLYDSLLPEGWLLAHCLDDAYGTFRSCTKDEWFRWMESGRAGISAFPLPKKTEVQLGSRSRLEAELAARGMTAPLFYPYVTTSFQIDDWDFDASLWVHWLTSAKNVQSIWGRLGDIILAQAAVYGAQAKTARATQMATTGSVKALTHEPVLAGWVVKLRQHPCVRDTRGAYRVPVELLRRAPATEPFLGIESFVESGLDTEATRPLLVLLGVRDTPTDPDVLLDCLRALAGRRPPAEEVEKWYRRLDQMLETASSAQVESVRSAFSSEELILTESSEWASSGEVFLGGNEEDVPGAALIRASVRSLSMWFRLGVAERPTADLALAWLRTLPSGEAPSAEELRRIRALLPRHAVRIWNECGHWLNLAGKWVPVPTLEYAMTMQSLIQWSNLHEWVKERTGDLQKLTLEVAHSLPFSALPALAASIELRASDDSFAEGVVKNKPWLTRLGSEIGRVQLADPEETERVRELGFRLARTEWIEGSELDTVPYIGGVPAGTARRADVLWREEKLHVAARPASRLAKGVSDELARAFGHRDVADIVRLCFERSPEFVSEVIEETFNLAPQEVSTGADSNSSSPVENRADLGLLMPAPTASSMDEAGIDADEAVQLGVDDIEEEWIERPTRMRQAGRSEPSVLERFALLRGFVKDGGERFYKDDGSWIAKSKDSVFPWEHWNAGGELVRSYWASDRCIELRPLQLHAEVWGLIERSPERYSLVLLDANGAPIEVEGAFLKQALAAGRLRIFPESYRLVLTPIGTEPR